MRLVASSASNSSRMPRWFPAPQPKQRLSWRGSSRFTALILAPLVPLQSAALHAAFLPIRFPPARPASECRARSAARLATHSRDGAYSIADFENKNNDRVRIARLFRARESEARRHQIQEAK